MVFSNPHGPTEHILNVFFPDPCVSGIVFSRRRAGARRGLAGEAARARVRTPLPLSSPAALLLLASGLESWPDSRLALAGGSRL